MYYLRNDCGNNSPWVIDKRVILRSCKARKHTKSPCDRQGGLTDACDTAYFNL